MSFEPTGVYSGTPYRTADDGSVEAMFPGGLVKFGTIEDFYEAFPVTRHKRVAKTVAMAIGGFVLLLFGLAAFQEFTDMIAFDETYARANGMTVKECVNVSTLLRLSVPEAEAMCSKRQPKKK